MQNRNVKQSFADYKTEGHNWITLASGDYYPDILKEASLLYTPVLVMFEHLLKVSESSSRFLTNIAEVPETWMRIQLARVFRKYVSPGIPVEMLKRKTMIKEICEQFGHEFRPIHEVQVAFTSRPIPDEALCALLWEYKTRGKKGYDLTERFFDTFSIHFPELHIKGPKRAGADIRLGTIFPDYPNPDRPVDFTIYDSNNQDVLAIGFARYDGDRGGTQEDDRIGGYRNSADELLTYAKNKELKLKLLFINDGPGLLLGSMWDDYSRLEESWKGKIIVSTLRMFPERVTYRWLQE